ncbi:MAG: hypothetical protein QNK42_17415 [Pseudodonghicola sp.]|nr:hypothetical protein [Pseudodonghicola sp.]
MKAFHLAPIMASLAGPALAHADNTIHMHESQAGPVVLGLALIAVLGAITLFRRR